MCRLGNSTGQTAWVLQQINYKENKVVEWDSVNPRLKRHIKLKKKKKLDKTKIEYPGVHKNKEMDDIKKGKEVITIKVRLVVTLARRKGVVITMGPIERFLLSGKVLALFQVVVTGCLPYNNYIEIIQ